MADPFISICIPAYQRVSYLERLLESIMAQDYPHFEVVVTDDSPDGSVRDLVGHYQERLPLRYYKNGTALGTPENWNEGIRQAKGEWIKIMHDDDWFVGRSALGTFAATVSLYPEANFVFSAYNNVREPTGAVQEVRVSPLNQTLLRRSPWCLLGENYIGNPSCTLFKKMDNLFFDKNFKWVVDFEFYIRYLDISPVFEYIDEALINVGINDSQVTNYTFGVTTVQVPENHLLLIKNGVQHLKSLVVYDYFWRLYRNLDIHSVGQVSAAGYESPLPPTLRSMIRWQSHVPAFLLKNGYSSKTLMLLHYLTHFYRL